MSCRVGLLIGLTYCASAFGQAPASGLDGVKLDFAVHDISARQLLILVADLTDTNWVVGSGILEQSVAMTAASIDAPALITNLLANEKLRWIRHKNTNIVLTQCRLDSGVGQRVSLPLTHRSGERLSLSFSRVSASAVFMVLGDFADLEMVGAEKSHQMTIRSRDQSWSDTLRATLIAEDLAMMSVTANSRTKWVSYWPANYACPKPDPSAAKKQESAYKEPDACRRKQLFPDTSRCEPLEYYPAEQLQPRGYIGLAGRKASLSVLLQTPEGSVRVVKPGSWEIVGEQMGRIVSADREGFTLEELVIEDEKIYQQSTRVLYDGERVLLSKVLQKRQ